jgi:DNA-binding transcriptional ArsR family regulator
MTPFRRESSESEQQSIAEIAKLLSNPARVAILEFLMRTPQCICNDIVEEVQLAQPTISLHLKDLKQAGWITGTIEGRQICYCIDEKKWEEVQAMLMKWFGQYQEIKHKCC